MNYLNQALLFYLVVPPLLALAYCGTIRWGLSRGLHKRDQELSQQATNVVSFRRAA